MVNCPTAMLHPVRGSWPTDLRMQHGAFQHNWELFSEAVCSPKKSRISLCTGTKADARTDESPLRGACIPFIILPGFLTENKVYNLIYMKIRCNNNNIIICLLSVLDLHLYRPYAFVKEEKGRPALSSFRQNIPQPTVPITIQIFSASLKRVKSLMWWQKLVEI